jgi:hypothetical protein
LGVDITIRHATREDARQIADKLRQADKREVFASCGLVPERALDISVRLCPEPLLGIINGEPVSIWGVNPGSLATGHGIPWMLGTDKLDRYAKHWLPVARRALNYSANGYNILENYVDVRNRKSVRWLKWMGFEFDEARPYGHLGLPFYRFTMVRV